jgi:hypothetical protein
MQVSRSLDRVRVDFDDERLVANAGLLAPASLAERLGLKDLLDESIDLGDVAGHANPGAKAMTVIHAVLAGADSIDDCDVLRSGASAAVLGHRVAAPSTLGTFLRGFSWAHSRQLDHASAVMLTRAWAAGAGPADPTAPFTIDVDSSIHETYGLQKQGATKFTYTHVRGYHPLYATAGGYGDPGGPGDGGDGGPGGCGEGGSGEVLHARLRGGNSHTARGAAGFLAETFARVRAGGVSGPMRLRGDSGFYQKKVVDACRRAGAGYSITVKMSKSLLGVISAIAEGDWQPIPYWLDAGADVAVIGWRAFKSRGDKGVACRLVVRRVKPTPGSQLALIATYSYHAFITDLPGDAVSLDAWHRGHAVVENAIRDLKYGVGLNHLPSGRFGANAAWLALNIMAHNMSRWTVRIGGLDIVAAAAAPSGQAASATDSPAPAGQTNRRPPRRRRRRGERVDFVATDTLRRRYLAVPGRLATSARTLTLHLPARWPWATQFNAMLDAIRAVPAVT